ncbi:MAG: hypothetical protein WA823_19195 [Candidatus Acidiferrales bacterium]
MRFHQCPALAATIIFTLAIGSAGQAQQTSPAKPKGSAANSSGTSNCAAVLQLPSSDWIAEYTKEHSSSQGDTIQAIDTYAKCYEARTNRLATALGRAGKGPLMGANGNFRDFQAALKDFSTKALADTIPPADSVKSAYASLYALQFRYQFLEGYAHREDQNRSLTPDESDEMAKAKNRFGELLGLLKMDPFHEVHSAFSNVVQSQISDVTKLEVYRYGIFILARPGEKPFSPPPF